MLQVGKVISTAW